MALDTYCQWQEARDAGRYTRTEAADIVLDVVPSGHDVAVNAGVAMRSGTTYVFGVERSVPHMEIHQ